MKTIQLTRGATTYVDDEDFEMLNAFKWHCTNSGYASRSVYNSKTRTMERVYMHRTILGVTDPKQQVDHLSGDRLDNRRQNLRLATSSQNQANSPKKGNKSSRFKGVTWNATGKRWMAVIIVDGKNKYLGTFRIEEAAALKYNEAALEYFGEFARPNQLTKEEEEIGRTPFVNKRKSNFKGVRYSTKKDEWQSVITVDKKEKHLGFYKTQEAAALAYNKSAIEHFGSFAHLNVFSEEQKATALATFSEQVKSSGYRGVCFHKRSKKWQANIFMNGQTHHLGYFDSEIEAAKSYNEAAINYKGTRAKLNPV